MVLDFRVANNFWRGHAKFEYFWAWPRQAWPGGRFLAQKYHFSDFCAKIIQIGRKIIRAFFFYCLPLSDGFGFSGGE